MDYEKEYKEALERAKQINNEHRAQPFDVMTRVFSELKDSDDEKIRKRILLSLEKDLMATKNSGCNTKDLEECITWLEKQGEKPQGKTALEAIKEEKVDNANKVEPKFKVGDWVVLYDSATDIDKKVVQISRVEKSQIYEYWTRDGKWFGDGTVARLWDITKDAKDGDVLQLGEVTAIFKEFISNNNCRCYCSVCGREFEIPSQEGDDNSYGCYNATPATKEEHDLLFRKMKEAGYEWDTGKKELNKIHVIDEGKSEMDYCFTKMMNGEQVSSAWSEEDIFKVQRICKYLDEAKKYYADITEVRDCVDWLKSLKDRVQPQWKPKDVHLEALRCVINGNNLDVIALKDLLEQLKRL